MFDVGSCPICGNGLRGVRICCGRPVIVCDECDAVWSSPNPADRVSATSDPRCNICGRSLWGEQARWATQTEVEAAGWWSQVSDERHDPPSSETSNQPDSAADRVVAPQAGRGSLAVILLLLAVGAVVAAFAVL